MTPKTPEHREAIRRQRERIASLSQEQFLREIRDPAIGRRAFDAILKQISTPATKDKS